MKRAFNTKGGPPVRYSSGALYTRKELTQVLTSLAREGYQKAEELPALGMEVYRRTEPGGKNSDICIYLDHLGCHPNNSGTMLMSDAAGGVRPTTVWDYAKELRGPNPVMKLLRRMF